MFLRFGPLWKPTFSRLETRPRKGSAKNMIFERFGLRLKAKTEPKSEKKTPLVFDAMQLTGNHASHPALPLWSYVYRYSYD